MVSDTDKKKRKPGPDPEHLKIDEDPDKALDKLLRQQPKPDKPEPKDDE